MNIFDEAIAAENRRRQDQDAHDQAMADKAQMEIRQFVDAMIRRRVPTDTTVSLNGQRVPAWRLIECSLAEHEEGVAISTNATSHWRTRYGGDWKQCPSSELTARLAIANWTFVNIAVGLAEGRGPVRFSCY